jgi:hypothetical protein
MGHKSYRDGDYEYQLWDFRGGEFIEDPEEDIDSNLRGKGQDAAERQSAYDEYLLSDYWQRVRRAMMIKHDCKCEKCGSFEKLQVHHKSYPKRYTELDNLHMLELL